MLKYIGGLSWSYDEKYVTYVAHPKKPKSQTSFEAPYKSNKFEYEENWGEKLESISSLVICIVDIQTGRYMSLRMLILEIFSSSSSSSLHTYIIINNINKYIYIYIYIYITGKIDVLDELSQGNSDCIGSPSFSPTNNYGLVYTGTTVSTLSYSYWSFLRDNEYY